MALNCKTWYITFKCTFEIEIVGTVSYYAFREKSRNSLYLNFSLTGMITNVYTKAHPKA